MALAAAARIERKGQTMKRLTLQQLEELQEIARLALAVEMTIGGSVGLADPERAAIDAIATQVASRMRDLVDAITDEDESHAAE
jgi:hypothetical protein